MRQSNNYGGGNPPHMAPHYDRICVHCGRSVPKDRWKKLTCDDTCERARNSRRTRAEQYWRDYSDGKVVV